MDRQAFERLVRDALSSIPGEFQTKLDNVELLIADWPSPEQIRRAGIASGQVLLGLYEGVPHPRRSRNYGLVTPDTITLFRLPMVAAGRTRSGIAQTIRRTVLHEIAHHFGFDEDSLNELGY